MGEVKALRIDRLTPAPATLASAAGAVLAPRCHRATSALARAVGLLATPDLRPDEALWIERCRSVHTLGLRVAIGCAFVDADGRVLRVVDPLPAGRVAGAHGARAVVECPAGVLGQVVAPGDVLRLVPPPPAPPRTGSVSSEGGESRPRRASCPRRARATGAGPRPEEER